MRRAQMRVTCSKMIEDLKLTGQATEAMTQLWSQDLFFSLYSSSDALKPNVEIRNVQDLQRSEVCFFIHRRVS